MSDNTDAATAATPAVAPSKKAARTGPAGKTTVPKKAAKLSASKQREADAAKIKNSELAIKAIEKLTGHKPIGLNQHPLPCVSSGSMPIDHIIGGILAPDKTGPLCPGYPRGRITEIYGAEASGKTTLALEAIREVQRAGGTALFLDFEHALAHKYARDLGVDFDPRRLMNYQPDHMEQGFEMMRLALLTGVDLVVVDSVAAMVPKAEMEKSFEDPSKIGIRALKLADFLPKTIPLLKPKEKNPLGTALIMINQTRANISTSGYGGGAGDSTAGGKALKFYAYLRLQTTCVRTERIKAKDPITKKEKNAPFGSHTQVKVVKSKVDAKQGQTADIFIRYGKGVDDLYTLIESGVAHRLVKKTGGFYELGGQKYQGRERLRSFLAADSSARDELQAQVLKSIRMQAEVDPETEAEMALGEDDEVDALISSALGLADDDELSADIPEEVEVEAEGEGD